MQSLNLASETKAWCTVRPYSQAVAFYRVGLQPGELIQTVRFYLQGVEFVQMYLNKFRNATIHRLICKKYAFFPLNRPFHCGYPNDFL